MAINSIGFNNSVFGQAVLNLNNQLTNLSTQLATGEKSTTYSGFGPNEGFAIAARAQIANISAFGNTITNLNTTIDAANTALQSISKITGTVKDDATAGPLNLNSTGQTISQANALTQLSSIVGILNTQVGDRFIFSGSAINAPAVNSVDNILNGSGTQAGLKQVIAERAQADGTTGLGRLVISSPATTGIVPNTTTSFAISEDAAGSPFGLKLASVTSSLTGATVTGPSGSPESVSVSFGSINPNPGDQITLNFNLPDGTTESVQLAASSQNPPPSGSFLIGTTAAATSANLNAALNTAIGTLANTSLVAASAVAAGHDFFDPSGTVTGSVATNKGAAAIVGPPAVPAVPPAPITAATALSGTSADSLAPALPSTGFQNGDAITVNGTTITFSNTPNSLTGPTYNINPATSSVGDLLSAIDSITGTTTPSSIDGGAVTLNTPNAANFSITTSASDTNAQNVLVALGFGPAGATITATQPPLRVSSSGSVTGAVSTDQQATPQPIASGTALSGAAGSASLSAGFQAGDVITVNGTNITFVASGATGNQLNVTDNVQTLLSKIDSITGTSIPSTVSGGAVTINTPNVANFSISALSSDPTAQAALAALGFSQASGTATTSPSGTNIIAKATGLVNGSANTVAWYTGHNSPSPRASANALIDSGISVQYGIQANEQALRQQVEGVAVFAALTEPATLPNSTAQASALSQRIATNLTSQPGQQTISDIQTDLANAQVQIQAATSRQTQTQNVLQNLIGDTETASTQEVASEILAIQTALSASFQTTSILSKLTLTNFLPAGG
jgi:flagellar hook-associated protein 3 FlgL